VKFTWLKGETLLALLMLASGLSLMAGNLFMGVDREAPRFKDLLTFYVGNVCVADSPYDSFFLYPPPAALFFLPFCGLPEGVVVGVFLTASIASIFVASLICLKKAGMKKRWAVLGGLLVMLWYPAYNTLSFGQINGILMLLTTLLLFAGREVTRGFLLAVSGMIKIWPFSLALTQNKKTLVWTGVFSLLLLVASQVILPKFTVSGFVEAQMSYHVVNETGDWVFTSPFSNMNPNWSLVALVFRITRSTLVSNIFRGLMVGLFIMMWRKNPVMWTFFLPFMVSSNLHTHHLISILPPILLNIRGLLKEWGFYIFVFLTSFTLHLHWLFYKIGLGVVLRWLPPAALGFIFLLWASIRLSGGGMQGQNPREG